LVVSELALVPSGLTLRRWDVAAAVYTLAFLSLGAVAGWQIWSLAELHRSLLEGADALSLTARAVGLVGELPVVGNGADQLAGSITDTAAQLRTNALAVRTQVHALAVVVGVAIALLPTVPLLALYLPLRVARARELAGLRRKLAGPADPLLVEHLAHAALRRVPYAQLRRVSRHPWRDVEQGRHEHLAAAELRRLGLRPPDWPPGPERGRG
jgi:hypothetical protein